MNLFTVVVVLLSFLLGEKASANTNSALDSQQQSIVVPGYTAQIQRTSHNVAHITASNLSGAWFGQGYAMAEDRVCTVMDQVLKIRGERSRYFGPGPSNSNIDSDFGYRHLGLIAAAERDWQALPANIREMLTAHAAGINTFVGNAGLSGLPFPCRNAEWIVEVTPLDLFAHSVDFALTNSSGLLLPFLNNAQPPGSNSSTSAPATAQLLTVDKESLGSNGWGLGGDATASGNGILLAQPHFPWEGELQSWESHITVPGKIDAYGVTLPGIPNMLVGFNGSVAWTLTVTPSTHHTLYKLALAPGDPTKYVYDGEIRTMQATVHTIDVRDTESDEISQQSRTLWRSHYGPILSIPPFLIWKPDVVLTYRDANLENRTYLNQLFDMSRADGINSFIQAHQRWASLPFSHTVASSIEGDAWYADSSPVPKISDETYARWQQAVLTDPAISIPWNFGIYAFDGSTSRDEWIETAGTLIHGTIPFAAAPQLRRRDFVFNANDNHWLSNPNSPLEGFSPLYGPERTSRSLRTRMNAVELSGASTNSTFSFEDVQRAALSNRSLTGELLRAELVQRCTATPTVTVGSESVDISDACAVLAAWDETFDLDSKGAVLFREFLSGFENAEFTQAGKLFAEPFDSSAPVTTPRDLASVPSGTADPVLVVLAQAVRRLESVDAGFSADSKLRNLQFTPKGDINIPIHGGQGREGIMNIASYLGQNKTTLLPDISRGPVINSETGLTDAGYVVNFGTSFLMAVELTAAGPQCQAVLTFSQAEDPESPFFADQTELFSNKLWRSCLYTQAAIQADPALRTYRVHALTGDIDNDGDVDRNDIKQLLASRNTAVGDGDKRDLDGDGKITALDARKLILLCTHPRCADSAQ